MSQARRPQDAPAHSDSHAQAAAEWTFTANLRRASSASGDWWYVAVPHHISDDLADLPLPARGFGSIRVNVRCGHTTWATSVFPLARLEGYMLPIKALVRTKEKLTPGGLVHITLSPIM